MSDDVHERPAGYSSWAVGWSGFAGIMLILLGVFDIFQGLVALINDEFFIVDQDWIVRFNVTTWGWIHLILGVVLILSGIGIFSANVLARTVGVVVAGAAALFNFAWLPYYPEWSLIIIAICIAVIWALTARGEDITNR